MKDKDRVRQLAKLGITVESSDKVRHQQEDLLERLAHSSVKPERYAGLGSCDPNHCGRAECSAACVYGMLRLRLRQIPAILNLLKSKAPIHEVRVMRGSWGRPFSRLRDTSIAAAEQVNRRALDRLHRPGVIAVGTFKAAVAPAHVREPGWLCEIHQLVVGPDKEELEKAFLNVRAPPFANYQRVKEVDNLAQAVNNVLRLEIKEWQHSYYEHGGPRPSKPRRRELYRWLLSLDPTARLIRYGCDRHFNQLSKLPRSLQVKVPKKRPYPEWLRQYMFGNHHPTCDCRLCKPRPFM